ncbi:aldose 1-epimerase [Marvinbryantia formatexigens DSM 14469]|uniref:Aldose 1-epimerase n=1 Tax=Marvinbryantia formatexigens DSM 14469 TaxID=478749 RepID=C6LJ62_9FIRM|nr:aldose epimerase family protein [Marvinbryantia formatexigens]EET59382.1 aldose 1-epimerase [Marvinbryantia formatexigens DSM 14469]UWO24356.1 galactose mutarotase [Marvinbryantia formatexigens DSM 14469]SDF52524.1 aldose 1-epimerase [Marvinbryantia formatexigens]
MGIKISRFGKLSDGREAKLITLANKNGMTIEVTDYGATLVSVVTADKNGKYADVVLGYADVTDYAKNGGYFGATIGRCGNRIGGAAFTINGKEYQIDKNENGNSLHSGFKGYDKIIWDTQVDEENLTVTFSHHSPDMEQGFPGNFDVTVAYTLTEDNAVKITYDGKTDRDTIANMTNHSYFNLEGHDSGSILDHILWIDADGITAVDAESIPTGEILPVEGTPFDFRTEKPVGRDIEQDNEQLRMGGGYDHNFALNTDGSLKKIAQVKAPVSGRVMEVFTDCVGVQLYTGNFIEKTQIGKDGKAYDKRCGLCLETQFYPDAVNHENFASPVLKAGETYHTETIYRFS